MILVVFSDLNDFMIWWFLLLALEENSVCQTRDHSSIMFMICMKSSPMQMAVHGAFSFSSRCAPDSAKWSSPAGAQRSSVLAQGSPVWDWQAVVGCRMTDQCQGWVRNKWQFILWVGCWLWYRQYHWKVLEKKGKCSSTVPLTGLCKLEKLGCGSSIKTGGTEYFF